MALPLFPSPTVLQAPVAPTGLPGHHPEIDSGFTAPATVSPLKTGTAPSTSSGIAEGELSGETLVRPLFRCVSLRESFLVGRTDAPKGVEGQIVRANPTHTRLTSSFADTDAYAILLVDTGDVIDPPLKETDKVPAARLAGHRGRRGDV